jgi:fructokinase
MRPALLQLIKSGRPRYAAGGNYTLQILTIGELLWDVFGQTEYLGGAPLNFSAAVQRLGNPVALITGVGDDQRGIRALQSMGALGLSLDFVQVLPGIDTGTAKVTTNSAGNASYYIQRPAAFDEVRLDEASLAAIAALHPGWVYFGTLAQTHAPTFEILKQILERLPESKCFYDMNLRDGHWNLPLVQRLSGLASILKLNDAEAETLFGLTRPGEEFSLEKFCRYWSSTYSIDTICVTLGSQGCAIFRNNAFLCFDGFAVKVADTVGAGDAFAAAFLHGFELQWPMARTACFANALGALVASRAGATPAWTVEECLQMIAGQEAAQPQLPQRS